MLVYLCMILCSLLLSHNAYGQDLQLSNQWDQEIQDPIALHYPHFTQPIKFTQHGLRCFIKHVYNVPDYATESLPNNFFHMIQFLQRKTDQIRSYYQSVLRMFGNKLKQTMYINPYAYSEMLDEMLPLMKNACTPPTTSAYTELQKNISRSMYDSMLNKFDYLKLDPNAYFDDLSQNIISLIHSTHELSADSSVEELRKSLLVFFEMSINKLVWDPNAYKDAWQNVKLISDQLAHFHQQGVLDDEDDLNGLYITLLERFCLYLDLSYSEIPLTFYTEIRQDIAKKNLALFSIEEEQFFETKAQRLERAITMTEAKSLAYRQGILVS